jgi:hypothetical protein
MEVNVKDFCNKESMKLVGFTIKENGNTFLIDKQLPLVDGKTEDQYVQEAFALCADEIQEWKQSFAVIGRKINPETGAFE